MHSSTSVILLAGGKGTRMGGVLPKQFLPLGGKPVVLHSLEVFLSFPSLREIIVIAAEEYRSLFEGYPVSFAPPGARRQDSVYSGLQQVSPSTEWVCIHDAARPFITKEHIEELFKEGCFTGAATLGMPVKWTIKMAQTGNFVEKTLDRSNIWEIQTPQIISKSLLKKGFNIVQEKSLEVTDDVSIVELLGQKVKLVKGSYSNVKITTPEDLAFAQHLLDYSLLGS